MVSRDVIFVENVFDHSVDKGDEPCELLPAILDSKRTKSIKMVTPQITLLMKIALLNTATTLLLKGRATTTTTVMKLKKNLRYQLSALSERNVRQITTEMLFLIDTECGKKTMQILQELMIQRLFRKQQLVQIQTTGRQLSMLNCYHYNEMELGNS